MHLNPQLQTIPCFSFEVGLVGDLLALLEPTVELPGKGDFKASTIRGQAVDFMIVCSKLRTTSPQKCLQLQPWEVKFRKLLSSAVLPRKQELSGTFERLEEEATIALLLCFEPPKEEVKITQRRLFE